MVRFLVLAVLSIVHNAAAMDIPIEEENNVPSLFTLTCHAHAQLIERHQAHLPKEVREKYLKLKLSPFLADIFCNYISGWLLPQREFYTVQTIEKKIADTPPIVTFERIPPPIKLWGPHTFKQIHWYMLCYPEGPFISRRLIALNHYRQKLFIQYLCSLATKVSCFLYNDNELIQKNYHASPFSETTYSCYNLDELNKVIKDMDTLLDDKIEKINALSTYDEKKQYIRHFLQERIGPKVSTGKRKR